MITIDIMDLKDLVIFKVIYELNSLNKAAKYLGCTQSNITARLKKMEHEFKSQFCIRSHHGINITESGEQFYQFALQVLERVDVLKKRFNHEKNRLLTSELLLRFIIIDHHQYSLSSTEIINKKTGEIERELNHHFYDDVITFNKLDLRNYRVKGIYQFPIALLQSDLLDCDSKIALLPIFINRDEACPLRRLSLAHRPDHNKLIDIDSLENILHLVKEGKGIAFLPKCLISQGYKQVDEVTYNIPYYHYQYS